MAMNGRERQAIDIPTFSQIPLYLSWIKQIAVIYALDGVHVFG